MKGRFAGLLRRALVGLIVAFLALSLLEGLCTFVYLGWDLATKGNGVIAERQHTEHDGELGWIGRPGLELKDFYGPGRHLRTNAERFRNQDDTARAVPAGRTRIICSGDSFTLGYGVGDADTWPSRLSGLDARLDVVNMGQGGYGVDQSFLWYEREREKIEHHLHLFSFIHLDFDRMRRESFVGYGKPLLRADGDHLEVTGTPVPRREFFVPWINRKLHLLQRASLWRLMGSIGRAPGSDAAALSGDEARRVAALIFERLERARRESGCRLALVNLPTREECTNDRLVSWHRFVIDDCRRLGLTLIDLTGDFRSRPCRELDSLFLGPKDVPFVGAKGHYTARANELVAGALYRRLKSLPGIAERLE